MFTRKLSFSAYDPESPGLCLVEQLADHCVRVFGQGLLWRNDDDDDDEHRHHYHHNRRDHPASSAPYSPQRNRECHRPRHQRRQHQHYHRRHGHHYSDHHLVATAMIETIIIVVDHHHLQPSAAAAPSSPSPRCRNVSSYARLDSNKNTRAPGSRQWWQVVASGGNVSRGAAAVRAIAGLQKDPRAPPASRWVRRTGRPSPPTAWESLRGAFGRASTPPPPFKKSSSSGRDVGDQGGCRECRAWKSGCTFQSFGFQASGISVCRSLQHQGFDDFSPGCFEPFRALPFGAWKCGLCTGFLFREIT